MQFEDQHIIESGNKLSMYRVDPAFSQTGYAPGRIYECKVLSVMGKDMLKLSLPNIYEEPWMPPLDGIYHFSVMIEEAVYSGKGKIRERFRDKQGDCVILKLIDSLSLEEKKEFINLSTDLSADVRISGEEEPRAGRVTSISVNIVIFECDTYIEDDTGLNVRVCLDNGREISAEAVVSETIRLRGGKYQSRLLVTKSDISNQRELAVWLLQHYKNQ